MAGIKGKAMSREQASELYSDLRKAMGTLQTRKGSKGTPDKETEKAAKAIAESISKSIAKDGPAPAALRSYVQEETADAVTHMQLTRSRSGLNTGHYAALVAVIGCALFKVILSVFEVTGIASATPAQASMQSNPDQLQRGIPARTPGLSKEEIRLLTSLDGRRAELEERSHKIDERELDISRRDKEFVAKLQQLRDLTEQLKLDREKNEKKHSAQFDQLANVYGSMAPMEAAGLIEQLDITIALPLMERMPEKRIGQILALMSRERALAITKMLSERGMEK